jgi:hypothetical protein
MPEPQKRQSNKDDNPLFNLVDQICNAEPAVTATSGTTSTSSADVFESTNVSGTFSMVVILVTGAIPVSVVWTS